MCQDKCRYMKHGFILCQVNQNNILPSMGDTAVDTTAVRAAPTASSRRESLENYGQWSASFPL